MPDDRFDLGAFRPGDDEDDLNEGPIIDVTPRQEDDGLFSSNTDFHILDDLLKKHKLDRSDKTKEDEPNESVIGFVLIIIFVIGAIIFLISLF